MLAKNTVCEIFRTMEYSENICNNKEGKDWLARYNKLELFCGHTYIKSVDKIDASKWKHTMNNVVSLLEMNRELLIQLLNETLFSTEGAKEIVSTLCNDFSYYTAISEDVMFHAFGEDIAEVFIGIKDIYILGRLLAPLLITGYTIRIRAKDNSLIPYLVAIGDIIINAGVPKGAKYVFVTEKEANEPMRLVISGDDSPCCPMVIFEDSDVDSALDSLIDSSSRFGNKIYWSITHVYIQEPLFNQVILKLQNIPHPVQHIKFLTCDQRDQLPLQGSESVTFCIGWDPQDLEIECDYKCYVISVEPFRTMEEGVSLINAKKCLSSISVWTEKLSIANHFSKLLKISTIWINSHGLIDPSVPFESFTNSIIPINGLRLLEYLRINNKKALIETNLPAEIGNKEFSKSFEQAVNLAKRGYEIMNKLDDKTFKSFVNSIFFRAGLDREISLSELTSHCNTIYHPTPDMNVLCNSEPYKVVMIVCSFETFSLERLLQVVYYAIATKNAPIICAPSILLNIIAIELQLAAPKSQPKFLQETVILIDVKLFSYHSEHVKRIGKIFPFDLKHIQTNTCCKYSSIYFPSLFLCKKVTWMSSV